ncbi:hypothetical protein JYQ62_12210 [Nostoc sp. UHCC 0702]|nr:hypothetical protein JYQ62_12210 [Nostoc sp. UHCC 0702]
MISTLRNPLPMEEYTNRRVVVYFYSGRWIPIMFYTLKEAIALHHKAQQQGKELFVFPPDCNPNNELVSIICLFPNWQTNSIAG